MANARHATLGDGGGGKFNNVDGVITDYEFTTEHPFSKGGKRSSKSDFSPLYGVLTARMDGTTEPDIDVMLVGSADDFVVSDEGKTITPVDSQKVWSKSQWGKLIASMETAGIATENADYAEGVYNYDPILGQRVRFQQEVQLDKAGKVKTRTGKGRDGKPREYNDTTTIVVQSYGEAEVPKKGAKVTANTKVTKAAGGKANGKAVEVDLTDIADEALAGLIEKFGSEFKKDKLVSAPGQLYLKKNFADNADELRVILHSDAYLSGAEERGILGEYSAKTGLITAAV